MDIAFRVDATPRVGTGHLSRCSTLAGALAGRGARVLFVTGAASEAQVRATVPAGCAVAAVPADDEARRADPAGTAHADWLDTGLERDAAFTAAAVRSHFGGPAHWLVVDHYALAGRWFAQVRGAVRRILAIDDLGDRPLDCDLLLDQTFGRTPEPYRSRVPPACRLLLGSEYALLREDFARLREDCVGRRRRGPGGRRILVSFGGVDADNWTVPALDGLRAVQPPVAVDVVLGRAAPHRDAVARAVGREPGWTLHHGVAAMAPLMCDMDLAVGACGFTTWERCALGLPAVVMPAAANQRFAAAGLQRAGAIRLLEGDRAIIALEVRSAVTGLLEDGAAYRRMVEASAAVCDGAGTGRVMKVLQEAGS